MSGTGNKGGAGIVKALVWHKSHMPDWNGDYHTVPTAYTVRHIGGGEWGWKSSDGHGYASSPEGAMRDAEANHQRRTLSALTEPAKAAAAPEMHEALDHQILRQLFGEIEDSGTPEANRLWAIAQQWFEVRDAALRRAEGRED